MSQSYNYQTIRKHRNMTSLKRSVRYKGIDTPVPITIEDIFRNKNAVKLSLKLTQEDEPYWLDSIGEGFRKYGYGKMTHNDLAHARRLYAPFIKGLTLKKLKELVDDYSGIREIRAVLSKNGTAGRIFPLEKGTYEIFRVKAEGRYQASKNRINEMREREYAIAEKELENKKDDIANKTDYLLTQLTGPSSIWDELP